MATQCLEEMDFAWFQAMHQENFAQRTFLP